MNAAVDATLRSLNDCGCCAGLSAQTPVEVYNRPGLTAVAYRVGTHAQFKHTLLARLSASGQAALRGLNTRDDDDFSIALLDAWATVADVLTFYQERIANEAYLRTARERLSLLELARLIGYELRPGVAASTYLAFTLEEAPGALGQALNLGTSAQVVAESPPPITIEVGTKVQSIPGPGEQAQIFETVEPIEARPEWNALKPRLRQPQTLSTAMTSIVLQGTATNLKPGDTVLIVESESSRVTKRILKVTPDEEAKTTRIDFDYPVLSPSRYDRPVLPAASISDFPEALELDDNVVEDIIAQARRADDLVARATMQRWPFGALLANIARQTARRRLAPGIGVFAFRQHAAIFGHNAPRWDSLPTDLRYAKRIKLYNDDGTIRRRPDGTIDYLVVPPAFDESWEERDLEADNPHPIDNERLVYLDSTYPGIIKGSWIVLINPTGDQAILRVIDHVEITHSDFAISGKISRLTVEVSEPLSDFKMRTTTVLAQSEQLALADVPIEDPLPRNHITLDRPDVILKSGQRIILTGERSDLEGVIASEVRLLKEVGLEGGFPVLTFDESLTYSYVRHTVTINANVAASTHGESVEEILGSGDAGQTFQRFILRQPPLTYVGASASSGAQTTLEVRVNDLLWHEVPTFYLRNPEEHIYVTHTDDDGNTTLMFGDGRTGARLPTGQENVRAKYRKGIGLPGLVKAHQLTQLMTRPLGVRGATNPLAADGAADRESLDEARRNAPLTVLTLGRIVSLQDYEDFTRAFAGIDKALATWTWSGERRHVFVTVAGPKGAEVPRTSKLYENLLTEMRKAGDPTVPLQVASYVPRLFQLSAAVRVHPDYVSEKVLAAVERSLRESFSFEARSFGQPVHRSEVTAVMQNLPGVMAVYLNKLHRTDQSAFLNPRLAAAAPRPGGDRVFAAELLTLDPRPLGLEVVP